MVVFITSFPKLYPEIVPQSLQDTIILSNLACTLRYQDNVKIDNFSCHSLRKAFGRKVFESSGENAQMALVKLSELFNHSSVAITKIYLGLREKELLETYDLLDF